MSVLEQRPGESIASDQDLSTAGGEIEGGFVDQITERPFNEPKHRAETAQKLAMIFAWVFAGALAVHYVAFMILAIMGRNESADALGRIFNVWLPALTGIVSSAATYYFTKER